MAEIRLEDAGKVAIILRCTCIDGAECGTCEAVELCHSLPSVHDTYAADLLDAQTVKIKNQEDELQYGADAIEVLTKDYAKLERELQEASTPHRTERCEEADYDCEALGAAQAQVETLESKIAEVTRERDSAKRDLDLCEPCYVCLMNRQMAAHAIW